MEYASLTMAYPSWDLRSTIKAMPPRERRFWLNMATYHQARNKQKNAG